jgi:hypothetical protein
MRKKTNVLCYFRSRQDGFSAEAVCKVDAKCGSKERGMTCSHTYIFYTICRYCCLVHMPVLGTRNVCLQHHERGVTRRPSPRTRTSDLASRIAPIYSSSSPTSTLIVLRAYMTLSWVYIAVTKPPSPWQYRCNHWTSAFHFSWPRLEWFSWPWTLCGFEVISWAIGLLYSFWLSVNNGLARIRPMCVHLCILILSD